MLAGALVLSLIMALTLLPQAWIRYVLARHSATRPDFPGAGGEFARHLLDQAGLSHVHVEQTSQGDHYDPLGKTVRLMPEHYTGRSLAAVVIAAHEVGHALQDAQAMPLLRTRTKLARASTAIQLAVAVVMIAAPLMMLLTRSPYGALIDVAVGVILMTFNVLMQVVTLPVEIDASFNRALPILRIGGYLPERDMPAARQILAAAAFTYVAAALMSVLNVGRWLRGLRI
jgi:Zn-dependent membrane protease YugP